ncbi:ral guanine nucleotide dissociation stimulator isoform X3 [Hydra vulgaris]|uniref:Ral guanine nucleotide dissociation stimulator isoform X3 n=1 Tax=Hydra vulgaris TaxID=6087 RepID=A0ABM4BCK1_HYDVU
MTAMSVLPEEESEFQEPLKKQPWWKKSPTPERSSPESKNKLEEITKDPQKIINWVELEENGTFYNTTLKKVRYRTQVSFDPNDPNTAFKQWEMVKVKQLKAGKIESLIEHMILPFEDEDPDPGFILAFLCTYKSFTSTTEVIDLLLNRFEIQIEKIQNEKEKSEQVIRRICKVISVWIDQYPQDFDDPPSYMVLNKIILFTSPNIDLLTCIKEVHNKCCTRLNNFATSPVDERSFKFKFCFCPSIIGCTCENVGVHNLQFKNFSAQECAEQLTLVDSELFLKVNPRESLGYFWSKRDKIQGSKPTSIKLTVDHFNAVSLNVISTVLDSVDEKSHLHSTLARSKTITKWLDIALELRELKNFSSLKAILSGLQCASIYRLTQSWELVPKASIAIFNELSQIFSDDMNNKASRDLLIQEGTAKYSTNSLGRSKSKRQSLINMGITHGTVPYLGTFLTDLTMIDTALPDKVKGDLINFEKRRKEFEVVILIKLLQQSAKNYCIQPNPEFFTWFNSLKAYSDKDSYTISLEVEPKNGVKPEVEPVGKDHTMKRYASDNDIFSLKQSSINTAEDLVSLYSLELSKSTIDLTDAGMILKSKVSKDRFKVESLSSRNMLDPDDAVPLDETAVVGKVYLEDTVNVQYKSVKITPASRACDVISSTLNKFKVSTDVSCYSLYQIIDNKKSLHIPMNSNMYYAMHKTPALCFKVSRKKLKTSKKAEKSLSFNTIGKSDVILLKASYSQL